MEPLLFWKDLEPASLRYIHNMIVHFPISLIILSMVFEFKTLARKVSINEIQVRLFNCLILFFLGIAVASGIYTADRAGITYSDPKWLDEMGNVGVSVLRHRISGILLLIVFGIYVGVLEWARLKQMVFAEQGSIQRKLAILIFIVWVSITAHRGGTFQF